MGSHTVNMPACIIFYYTLRFCIGSPMMVVIDGNMYVAMLK